MQYCAEAGKERTTRRRYSEKGNVHVLLLEHVAPITEPAISLLHFPNALKGLDVVGPAGLRAGCAKSLEAKAPVGGHDGCRSGEEERDSAHGVHQSVGNLAGRGDTRRIGGGGAASGRIAERCKVGVAADCARDVTGADTKDLLQ